MRQPFYILIAGLPLLVVLPFLVWGYPNGHDFAFHVNSWADVIQQWKEGVLFPRWAGSANFGFGEPRFIFYPPLSRMLAATLFLFMPWRFVPGAFVWIAVGIAGASMYRLARFAMPAAPSANAVKVAALFAANPYHLLVIYQRVALSELLASALFPVVVLGVLRLGIRGWRGVVPFAWVFGFVWLANAPAALIATYCVVLVSVAWTTMHRNGRILLLTIIAVGCGLAVAAFYILPAWYEQQWVNISAILVPGSRPEANFLFSSSPDVYAPFNRVISITTTLQVVLLAIALAALIKRRSFQPFDRVLFMLLGVSAALLLPWSLPIWRIVPGLEYVQFPWRWLFVFNVPFAFVLGRVLEKRGWAPLLILIVGSGFWAGQASWRSPAADRAKESVENGEGYTGVDEYLPIGADRSLLPRGTPEVSVTGAGRVQIERWSGQEKLFTVEAASPVTASVRLLAYPAWKAEVNGQSAPIVVDAKTKQIGLVLAPGRSQVLLSFQQTEDRKYGNLVSLSAVVALVVAGWIGRASERRRLRPA